VLSPPETAGGAGTAFRDPPHFLVRHIEQIIAQKSGFTPPRGSSVFSSLPHQRYLMARFDSATLTLFSQKTHDAVQLHRIGAQLNFELLLRSFEALKPSLREEMLDLVRQLPDAHFVGMTLGFMMFGILVSLQTGRPLDEVLLEVGGPSASAASESATAEGAAPQPAPRRKASQPPAVGLFFHR